MPGDTAVAAVELDPDGGISVYAAAADPGEGNDSMLTQLTAEFMGIGMDRVRLHTRDTGNTAASGPAAGSRVTYMIGNAVLDALGQLKAVMQETGTKTGPELEAAGKPRRYVGRKKNEAGPLDPKTGQGPSFESQVHAVQMVELEVDTESGKVRILKMTTAVDAGPVINPLNLTGQLEGGMDMGVGFALREEYVAGKTKDWVSFKFPTIRDTFEMETIIRETPRPKGPFSATGVGEMCLVPTAPAVVNAIRNAAGVWVCELPATPERIKAALAADPLRPTSTARPNRSAACARLPGARSPSTTRGSSNPSKSGPRMSSRNWRERAGFRRSPTATGRSIRFLREYYACNGRAPLNNQLRKGTGMSLLELDDLFPEGIKMGARRLAGLPNPKTCS